MIARLLKIFFILIFIRPLVFIWLGLNILGKENLPKKGPAIIAANHNSHLDTLVLLALYPISMAHKIRPVAAADYFLKNKILAWFSLNIIGIIPLQRSPTKEEGQKIFSKCQEALKNGEILIIFPEGSRGIPETMSRLKKGIYHLYQNDSTTQVYPVVMRGLGRSLPKGSFRFVPYNCDVVIGKALPQTDNAQDFMHALEKSYQTLSHHCLTQIEIDD